MFNCIVARLVTNHLAPAIASSTVFSRSNISVYTFAIMAFAAINALPICFWNKSALLLANDSLASLAIVYHVAFLAHAALLDHILLRNHTAAFYLIFLWYISYALLLAWDFFFHALSFARSALTIANKWAPAFASKFLSWSFYLLFATTSS